MKLKISEVIENLEIQNAEISSFLNLKTMKIVNMSDQDFSEAEEDKEISEYIDWNQNTIVLAREILYENHFIKLPTQYDINEYSIMEGFVETIENSEIKEVLYDSIKGRGAFSRFKDKIIKLNIREEWFKYKEMKYISIAKTWCDDNNIEYIND